MDNNETMMSNFLPSDLVGTVISRYIWDCAEGTHDRLELIGYCKEKPIDVLKELLPNYCIYSYINSLCRPIQRYPASVDGLTIIPVFQHQIVGCQIVGTLNDLKPLMDKLLWDKFSIKEFDKGITICRKYNTLIANDFEEVLKYYEGGINET